MIEALTNERLAELIEYVDWTARTDKAVDEVQAALRELQELRSSRAQSERDASRYRWLRDKQCGLELDPACEGIVFKVPLQIEQTRKVGMSGEDVDAAIDAAMAKYTPSAGGG